MSGFATALRIDRISNQTARDYLEANHPLGAGGAGVRVALGVFWKNEFAGVMTLGNPVCNLAGKAYGLKQHELIELKKMHVKDVCPRNSESRALAILARLVKKHWPQLKAIITYCDETEGATAYKAAGWLSGKAQRYARDLLIAGKWYTLRNANRLGITKQATETHFEHRRKWVLPLDSSIAALVQGQNAGLPARRGRFNSDHAASVQVSQALEGSLGQVKELSTAGSGASSGRKN